MSRDLIDENYYMTSGGLIPVKWTAPEVSTCMVLIKIKFLFDFACYIGTELQKIFGSE